MVRLIDLPEWEQAHFLAKKMPPLGPPMWVKLSKPMAELRIAHCALRYWMSYGPTLRFRSPSGTKLGGRMTPSYGTTAAFCTTEMISTTRPAAL